MPWLDDLAAEDLPADGIRQLTYLGASPTGRYTEPEQGRPEPQAFKVANGPQRDALRAHFHVTDQFQYIASGTGKLGAHVVHTGEVHYADRLTPYGPLASGPEGFAYVTLRPTIDMGISFMPESRDDLRDGLAGATRPAGARRSLTIDLTTDPDEPAAPAEGGWRYAVADADELRVATTELAPGVEEDAPVTGGEGAYLIVVRGALDDGGTPRRAGALRWSAPGERVHLVAGPAGARVAHLQFPRRDPAQVAVTA
jgi:hypothetical protein